MNQPAKAGQNLIQTYLTSGLGMGGEYHLKALIDAGVDMNDTAGWAPPCMVALVLQKHSLCLFLLKSGADPTVIGRYGDDVADYVEKLLSRESKARPNTRLVTIADWLDKNYRKIDRNIDRKR